jgi:hypothetical protein
MVARSLGADTGVVDETVNHAEFVAQPLNKSRDGVDHAQIERSEVKAAGACPGFADCRAQLVAFAPRHRNHIVAGRGNPSRDGEANSTASSGHQNVTHRIVPAFLPPSYRATIRI